MPTDNNSSYKAARLALVEADAALRTLAYGLRLVVKDEQLTAAERHQAEEQADGTLALANQVRQIQADLLTLIGGHRLPESTADLRPPGSSRAS
jgi:hypothetical protein